MVLNTGIFQDRSLYLASGARAVVLRVTHLLDHYLVGVTIPFDQSPVLIYSGGSISRPALNSRVCGQIVAAFQVDYS